MIISFRSPICLFHRQRPRGRAVKSADDHLTALSGVGSSTYETSQVLLVGVSGGFSRDSPVFHPRTDWPVSYELK